MDKITITAEKRKITGKKVKQLRKKGIVPANIYGKKVKSTAISVKDADFTKVYQKAGATAIVSLSLEGKEHPVLVHTVQLNPVSRKTLHVDFFEVDLKEKVTAKVPLVIVGESPVVKDKVGTLLSLISEVEIEALPADLLEKIEVDASKLTVLNQSVKVGELRVSDKVKILTDKDLDVVKVAPLVSKEAEQMAKEEAEKAAAAAAAVTPEVAASAPAAPSAPAPEKTPEASEGSSS